MYVSFDSQDQGRISLQAAVCRHGQEGRETDRQEIKKQRDAMSSLFLELRHLQELAGIHQIPRTMPLLAEKEDTWDFLIVDVADNVESLDQESAVTSATTSASGTSTADQEYQSSGRPCVSPPIIMSWKITRNLNLHIARNRHCNISIVFEI